MMINVTLATNRLQLETFVGGNLYSSVTYINIVAVSDGKDVNRLVTAPTPSGAPTTTTTQDDFIVRLHLADQLHVDLPLKYIANQAGWTNDQVGYEQAEADIYAAFPAGGGGGGGTVTSVGMTVPTFLSVAGSPIVGAGTLAVSLSGTALPIANGGTAGTSALTGRTNLEAAKNHGHYQAGLVVNGWDIVSRNDILYWSVSAQFTTTDWATDEASFTPIGLNPVGVDAAIAAAIPKRYKWIGDGGATTGTVVANTLGETINVTNPGAGQYIFTAASGTPFTAGKTTITVQNQSSRNQWLLVDSEINSNTVCAAYFADITGTGADPALYQVTIEVEP